MGVAAASPSCGVRRSRSARFTIRPIRGSLLCWGWVLDACVPLDADDDDGGAAAVCCSLVSLVPRVSALRRCACVRCVRSSLLPSEVPSPFGGGVAKTREEQRQYAPFLAAAGLGPADAQARGHRSPIDRGTRLEVARGSPRGPVLSTSAHLSPQTPLLRTSALQSRVSAPSGSRDGGCVG